ncbi:RecB family exonuclease [Modestobacter sp. VKM Ac-2984]|uniref:RecB family exonuclease n=1 Tax=Modestobacter sp. VKM Ac-2984 TaxID=3004138 RepID=UPI0022AAC68E|nr:PD-(D/E)XK nuclease family protein [Modestobacter sp. VKM Ac-2984]MCZ2816458.1 PD-(D/E)XK nuclease family protein [Modestobacter sp. VKM Ac-2984]
MSDQLEMPGMPKRLFSCTPSKLATFADCPRRYRFAYLTRPSPPKGPPWAHNTVGSAVHAALRSWWELPVEKRTPAAARQLLYSGWSRAGFRDDEQAAQWRARAAAWITDYVAELDPTDEPAGTERTVGATTEALALSGRVDRIDRRGDELVVVDYKTGRVPSTEDEARGSPALALYVLGVRRTLRRPCTRVELHHLPSGTVAAFEHTDRSLANHVRRAEDIAADIGTATEALAAGADADEAFPPVPGQQCSWCDFRSSCPTGQAAAPARETWSFLPTEPVTAPAE